MAGVWVGGWVGCCEHPGPCVQEDCDIRQGLGRRCDHVCA